MITTLSELQDFINENSEWHTEVNTIIKYNCWVDETGKTYGICNDYENRLQFNSFMEAEIVPLTINDFRLKSSETLLADLEKKGYSLELSCDEEYFNLVNELGELIFSDSACDDTYDKDKAVAFFHDFLKNFETFEDRVDEYERKANSETI